jgi:hypothetical protein
MSSKLWKPPCTSPLNMKKVLRILLGAHERSYWWLLWRILGGLSFTVIFGFITVLGSVNVFNSHFIWIAYYYIIQNIVHDIYIDIPN